MRYGSLFSGIGGFDIGFDRAGMTCTWQVEKDEKARNVLATHWPEVPKYEDIKDVGKRNLESVDLICGGFPCQDVSVAGRREGLAGERSGLWFEFRRIVEELKPQWVVIENVPGLLSSNGGRDMGAIVGGLAKLGYWWAYRVLDAQNWGVAQRRRRVFIVASLTRGCPQEVLFERESSPWDTPPRRETRAELARDVAATIKGGSGERGYPLEWEAGLTVDHTEIHGVSKRKDRPNGGFYTREMPTTKPLDTSGLNPACAQGGTVISFTQNTRDEVRLINGDGQISGALSAQPGTKQRSYIAFSETGAGWWRDGIGTLRERDYKDASNLICNTFNGYIGGADDNDAQGNHLVIDKPDDTLYNKGINHTGGLPNASTQETNSGEILPFLRKKVGEKAFAKWGLGILDSLQQEKILQPPLYGESVRRETSERESKFINGAIPCKKDNSSGAMREMWAIERLRCTSQKWELDGQFAHELRAYLSQLSQHGTPQAEALQSLWQASEGLGVLRQALSEIQEMGQSIFSKEQSTQSTYGVRRLTCLECERLQGFPDHHTAGQSDSARYRQLGNAVAVPVAEWLGRRMLEAIR